MSLVFIDTNIPMYAGGAPHPLRQPSQQIIMAIGTGELDAVTDAEVFQEILYRYLSIGRREQAFQIFDHFYRIMLGRILPIEAIDLQQARALAEHYPVLGARDLIHLAIMVRHRIPVILSADTGFDAIGEVRRLDPAAFAPPC